MENDTKQCSKCLQVKPLFDFSRKGVSPDGLQPACKLCVSTYDKQVYLRKRAIRLKQVGERYAKKAPVVIAYGRQWRRSNSEKTKAYYMENAERIKKAAFERRQSRLEEFREKDRQREKADPVRRLTKNAKRRATLMQRSAAWSDPNVIRFLYTTRHWICVETGTDRHVDHIVPLKGRRVSGLHTHTNLAVVPASVNLSKSNRF